MDMSCTLLHHGHIRLLKKAAELGNVVVALTTDDEIAKWKGYTAELDFEQRREILLSIQYVSEVIPSKWFLDDAYIRENMVDILVHGDDNSNDISECELVIFPRTNGISSSELRKRACKVLASID